MKRIYNITSLVLLAFGIVSTAVASPTIVPNATVKSLSVKTVFSKPTPELQGVFEPKQDEYLTSLGNAGEVTLPIGVFTVSGTDRIGIRFDELNQEGIYNNGPMKNENGDKIQISMIPTNGKALGYSNGYGIIRNPDSKSLSFNLLTRIDEKVKPGVYTATIKVVQAIDRMD